MYKLLVSLFMVFSLFIALGCGESPKGPSLTVEPSPNLIAPVVVNSTIGTPSSITASLNDEPPITQSWISPGKVNIGNYYSGAQAEWFIKVHNGDSTKTKYTVEYREPAYVSDGFVSLPTFNRVWVIVSESSPTLDPYETRTIPITLKIPSNAKIDAKKWEFWISVMEDSPAGVIKTELCSRWLITMR